MHYEAPLLVDKAYLHQSPMWILVDGEDDLCTQPFHTNYQMVSDSNRLLSNVILWAVWPERNRQKSIKVALNYFTIKIKDFDTCTKNCLWMKEIWAN